MDTFIPVEELRDLPIPEFLARLGFERDNKGGHSYQYHSMVRDTSKKTPSFSVWLNRDGKWKWKDWGESNPSNIQGGNIIDLAKAIWYPLPFVNVLNKIKTTFDLDISQIDYYQPPPLTNAKPVKEQYAYILDDVRELGNNYVLSQYLESRGVADLAEGILKEVYYHHRDHPDRKPFYALGWLNDRDNWEFSNAHGFKSSIGAKSISVIHGDPGRAVVFEGMMDFLSYLKMEQLDTIPTGVILNSTANLNRALETLKAYPKVDVYFDHDPTGRDTTQKLIANIPNAVDRSEAYAGYNDYNDKLKAEFQEAVKAKKPWEQDMSVEQYYPWYKR
jgi:hypothetical protein